MPSFLHLNANKHPHCFNRTLPKMSGSVHEGVKEERGKSNKKAAVASPLSCTYRCSNLIRLTFNFCEFLLIVELSVCIKLFYIVLLMDLSQIKCKFQFSQKGSSKKKGML